MDLFCKEIVLEKDQYIIVIGKSIRIMRESIPKEEKSDYEICYEICIDEINKKLECFVNSHRIKPTKLYVGKKESIIMSNVMPIFPDNLEIIEVQKDSYIEIG